MKKLFLATLMLITYFGTSAQNNSTDITKVLKFTNDNYNMGTIAYGKPTEFNVDIENISATPITLENVIVGNFSQNATLFFSGNMVKQVSFYGVGAQ